MRMTDAEWLASAAPGDMLSALIHHKDWKCSERKLRLFACACCRRIWDRLPDERSRSAVVAAEQIADGLINAAALASAAKLAWEAVEHARSTLVNAWDVRAVKFLPAACAAFRVAAATADEAAWGVPENARSSTAQHAEAKAQAALLRDLFGLTPFRPKTLVAGGGYAGNCDVQKLARVIYEGCDFRPMPILADALEEAGCTDADILAHCRGPAPHTRGCWVLDLLLGRP